RSRSPTFSARSRPAARSPRAASSPSAMSPTPSRPSIRCRRGKRARPSAPSPPRRSHRVINMKTPFILTLPDDADLGRLMGELVRAGAWARLLETRGSRGRLVEVDERSAYIDPAKLGAMPGVLSLSGQASGHPLVDARRGQSVAVGAIAIG